MKILIFYTPRSKSTILHDVLASSYNLTPLNDIITTSRIQNKNFSEYPELIDKINNTDNICVKLNGNDFIDLNNRTISDLYKTVDFKSFDKIIVLTRKNIVDAVASYSYMNQADSSSWHTIRGQSRAGNKYQIPIQKVFYLIRGFVVHRIISEYIFSKIPNNNIYYSTYEDIEQNAKSWFNVNLTTPESRLIPNNYNYQQLAENYIELYDIIHGIYGILNGYTLQQISDKDSFFWKDLL